MKKAIKGIAVLLVLIMTFTGCSYRGRTIREQIDNSQERGADASPSVISPSEGGYGSSGQMTVSLYFPYEEDNLLGREERVVDYSSSSRIEEVILQELIAQRDRSLLYDADGHFLPTVSDEVYHKAIAEVLESGTAPKTSSEMELTLVYRDGKWLIEAGEELLAALSGGI